MKGPLCLGKKNLLYDQDKHRSYNLCEDCELIFVSRDEILPAIDELKRYEAHQNEENDLHYQQYLQQIVDSSLPYLNVNAKGLDFGCGKTTLLAQNFKKQGLQVDSYDVFFHPSEEIFNKKYDFIVLSEVIEHLAHPRDVMEKLCRLLNPHGQFFIKTKLHPDDSNSFKNWFYKRDLTHVQFFNLKSFTFLAMLLEISGPKALNPHDLYLFAREK